MNGTGLWALLGSVSPAELVDPSLELHWAVQLIASAGQTFAEPRGDDSHRAMTWNPRKRAFVGAPFAGAYPFRVAVRPEDLTLVMLDRTDEPLGSFPLSGSTREDAYAWLGVGVATYLGGAPPEIERPEYDMPAHPVGAGAAFSSGRVPQRGVLAALYGSAAAVLEELISTRDDASPVRCWPHHFDIATLITLEVDDSGAATKTIGAGMAPMGGGYETWYWYVTPWPYPRPEALPPLPGPGDWHTEGWTGAVLTGEALLATDESLRDSVLRRFLDGSLDAAVAALAGPESLRHENPERSHHAE